MQSISEEDVFLLTGMGIKKKLEAQNNIPIHKQELVEVPKFRFREPEVVTQYHESKAFMEGKRQEEEEAEIVKKALQEQMHLNLVDGGNPPRKGSNASGSSSSTGSRVKGGLSSQPNSTRSLAALSARSTALQSARSIKAASERGSSSLAASVSTSRRASKEEQQIPSVARSNSIPFSGSRKNSKSLEPIETALGSNPVSARQFYPQMDVPDFVADEEDGVDKSAQSKVSSTSKVVAATPTPEPSKEFDIVPESMEDSFRERAPKISHRYFGPGARNLFFDRMRFLHQQRTITITGCDEDITELHFDNEDYAKDYNDYPFVDLSKEGLKDEKKAEEVEGIKKEGEAGEESKEDSDGEGKEEKPRVKAKEEKQLEGEEGFDPRAFVNPYALEFPSSFKQDDRGIALSPRSRFIAGCLKERKNARASLVLRKRLGRMIDISHMAIGNDVAKLLAECLGDMPHIESLNINNNNLTDEGVASILNAISPIKTLKSLNISRNKMDDDAAEALAKYVKMKDCPCETLIMQVSDVDDFEGETFVRCLMENRSITEIDLSDNLIGRAENMRTVIPDMCTCSEAFAEMLQVKDCILKKLTLAWNTIRLSSSISLTQSLRNNHSLTYLDLSYNSLAFDGGEALGDALLENTTLQYLNVASNNLNASATFTISTGIIENKALTRVILDNNPIGEAGASALMQVPMTVGARCSLSANKCNAGLVDPKCWFSHSNPLGHHTLDLSKPYERAVAFAMLELIANHATYIFVSAEYESPSGSRSNLNLFQTVIKDEKEKYFDAKQKAVISGLRRMRDASGDREKGIQFFHEADEDGGGSIDADELTDLLTSVGMDVTPDMIEDILDQYDIDGQGAIGMPEFLAFLKSQYKEATLRLEEMTEERIMATPNNPHKKYQPPRSGKCIFYVMDGFTRKAKYSVMSSSDQEYAKTVSSEIATMLGFAVQNSKVRLGEAMQMFSTMYNEGGQKATILAELVVKLADPNDCKKLVMKVTRGDKVQIGLLKNAMGGAYKPYLGILNGYYQLDLSHTMDQIALTRLLEQSQTDNTRRQAQSPLATGQMGDTSQCGNWTSFRNEFLNNKRFAIQPDKFRPMPKSGKLHFDYSNVARAPISEDLIIISDKRLVKILQNIFLVKEEEVPMYLKKLGMWRRHLMMASTGRGHMLPQYEYTKEKGIAIGKACDDFYTNLDNRSKLYSLGFKRENITADYQNKKGKQARREKKALLKAEKEAAKAAVVAAKVAAALAGVGANEPIEAKEAGSLNPSRKCSEHDISKDIGEANSVVVEEAVEAREEMGADALAVETAEDEGDKAEGEVEIDSDDEPVRENLPEGSKAQMKQIMNEEMAKYRMLIESPLVAKEGKSAQINDKLEDIFANVWVLCRHVAAIIMATPLATSARTDFFGSYHVDLIVSMFSRIVDIHNFEVIMNLLNAQECAQVYCRIGWLNIFNPTKPEGMYCLDFCRYEERLVAKMLIGLALVEPGDNWKDQSFSWAWDVDPVPGWELTTSYTQDESCTVKGIVQVRYYSGEGKGKAGCVAHGAFRKAMYSNVLSSEDVACIDFDAMFPYLVHGSADSDSDDADTKRDKLAMKEQIAEDEAAGVSEDEDPNETKVGEERPKMAGERYLIANPKMWQELFSPPNGCVKQKNPLSLIYTTQIQKDN